MKIQGAGSEVVDPNGFADVRLAAAQRLSGEDIIYFYTESVIIVGDIGRLGIWPDDRGKAEGIDRVFRVSQGWRSDSVPKPLLGQLVLPVNEPIEHSVLRIRINLRYRIIVRESLNLRLNTQRPCH